MIGLVVAAHGDVGPAMLKAAEAIVGPMDQAAALSLSYEEDPQGARDRLAAALRRLDDGQGVLVLTDMFGGTPTNLAIPFLEAGKVEVLTGLSLPMLLKAQTARRDMPLEELATFLKEYGARNIVVAGEVLSGKPGARAT